MTSHVLACALCTGASHTSAPASPWTVAAGVVIIAFIALVAYNRRKAGLPPAGDTMSPWARELLAGRNITAYRSSVRAETPAGIMVTYRECCRSGHQLPEQAVDHAGQIATRIGEHGR